LNFEELSAGGDDLVQRQPNTNDVTGDDGDGRPVMPAASILTSEVLRRKKRSHDAAYSNLIN